MFLQDRRSCLFTKASRPLTSPNSTRNVMRGCVFSHRSTSLPGEHITSNLCLLTFRGDTCLGLPRCAESRGHMRTSVPGGVTRCRRCPAEASEAPGLLPGHHLCCSFCSAPRKRYPCPVGKLISPTCSLFWPINK